METHCWVSDISKRNETNTKIAQRDEKCVDEKQKMGGKRESNMPKNWHKNGISKSVYLCFRIEYSRVPASIHTPNVIHHYRQYNSTIVGQPINGRWYFLRSKNQPTAVIWQIRMLWWRNRWTNRRKCMLEVLHHETANGILSHTDD